MTFPHGDEISPDAQSSNTAGAAGLRLPPAIRQYFSKINSYTESVRIVFESAGTLVASYTVREGPALAMAAGSNSDMFVGFSKNQIMKWQDGEPVQMFESSDSSSSADVDICAIAVRDQPHISALIFSGHNDGLVRARCSDGRRRHVFRNPLSLTQRLKNIFGVGVGVDKAHVRVTSLCISDDHKFIYSGTQGGTLNAWHVEKRKLVDGMQAHEGCINTLAVGPNIVFSGSADGTVKKWRRDHVSGKRVRHSLVRSYRANPNGTNVVVNCIAFRLSPEDYNHLLYAGLSNGGIDCWSDEQCPNKQPERLVGCLCNCPEDVVPVNALVLVSSDKLFAGYADGTIRLWHRNDYELHFALGDSRPPTVCSFHLGGVVIREHVAPVTCLAAHPDRHQYETDGTRIERRKWYLYSAAKDGTIKVWSVRGSRNPTQSTGSTI